MCCGQKRTELRNIQAQGTSRTVSQYAPSNNRVQDVRTQPPEPPPTRTGSPLRPVNTQVRSVQSQARTPTSLAQSSISIRYLENSPIRVRGLVSGMSYDFSGAAPIQQVDARDASSLLNTRFFRRA